MARSLFAAFCLLSLTAVPINAPLWAAVPANIIKGWQDSAPEAIDITVLAVDKNASVRPYSAVPGGTVTTTNVTLRARIDAVHRTTSNLVPGAEIVVKYVVEHYEPVPPPDGNYGTLLDPQDRATAYLKKSGDQTFDLSCVFGCLVKR